MPPSISGMPSSWNLLLVTNVLSLYGRRSSSLLSIDDAVAIASVEASTVAVSDPAEAFFFLRTRPLAASGIR